MKKKLLILTYTVIYILNLTSTESISDHINLNSSEVEKIVDSGNVINNKAISNLIYAPHGEKALYVEKIKNFKPDTALEVLYILESPKLDKEELTLYLLNNIRAFSDQKGLTYYSSVRKKNYPLIKNIYFKDIKKNKKIIDPYSLILPGYEVHRYYQNDTTFGGNNYQLITKTNDGKIYLTITNLDKLHVFGVFEVVDKGKQILDILVYPIGDKIVIYTLIQLKDTPEVKEVFGIPISITASVKKRMDVIVNWYKKRINIKEVK